MDFSYADVRAAKISLPPTPMWSYPVLNAAVGATVHVKHENVQPIGAFKIRGALNLLATSPGRGIVTYSTGNHAQAMAYASHQYDTPCTVVMPQAASPTKIAAVRAWGATVVLAGANLGESEAHAVELAASTGHRLVSPGDTPELLAGVGTLYDEILTARPNLSAIVVPVGSGTGAAAASVVAAELAPTCEIIGVQSASSPAAHDSWRSASLVTRPNQTRVEGLATGRGYELPQQIMCKLMSDFVLVPDDRIVEAQRMLASAAHTLAEGAGAAALAAVLEFPERFAGREIAVVCSGGNASPAELALIASQAN
ncbi:pyridoxal-phosphate dependent enzyme [Actinoplanes bogorensis]|uniref:Pyridoxal-phosphate dependent enzyme n=1 Tax=Paractinoplanes bogorensis TaxID=1610840 RepID=A0ABS5YG39_9ACTN|nr:pyridoxal-phosphate dependent enzyme [Actinoplanes bogorensis]MBU2662318.1 pyridoxal-phosphate dependent enzyme [Actinoplanes bogorensis]